MSDPLSSTDFAITFANLCLRQMVRDTDLRRATIFVGPDTTVKVSRQRRHDRRFKAETFLVTIGPPNFVERRFIKACQAAEEPFPVKKVQIKYWPARKSD